LEAEKKMFLEGVIEQFLLATQIEGPS